MVKLPFQLICVKGAVFLWIDYKFTDGEERNKYIIILSKDNRIEPILLVLTTSKVKEFYKLNRALYTEYYTISANEYEWFSKDTLLDFSKIISYKINELSSAYEADCLRYIGTLKEKHLKEIDEIIYKSEIIEDYKIEKIVSNLPT
jgi:hypothetical protein